MGKTIGSAAVELKVKSEDVERVVRKLFVPEDENDLIITVLGDDSSEDRADAFRELLESLSLYDDRYRDQGEFVVEPPSREDLARGLAILGQPHLQRKLLQRVLFTFGKRIIDPLGSLLTTSDKEHSSTIDRLTALRERIMGETQSIILSAEVREILVGDLEKTLTDEYLTMLAEHEELVQRPRAQELVQEILQIIGTTFQQAFQHWPEHAEMIAAAVSRRVGNKVDLRQNPVVIRDRIVEGIEEFLWYETGTEIAGALRQLLSQNCYEGLVTGPYPELSRSSYRQFAKACWSLIEQYG